MTVAADCDVVSKGRRDSCGAKSLIVMRNAKCGMRDDELLKLPAPKLKKSGEIRHV